jgi:hypothetical protein
MSKFLKSLIDLSPKEDKKGKNTEVNKPKTNVSQPQYQQVQPQQQQYQYQPTQFPQTDGYNMNMVAQPQPIDTSKFEQHLEELLQSGKKGIDIFEMLQSVNSLMSMGVPEVQAYQNAYITLKTMGITKEILISSCKRNMGIITDDQNNFTSEIQKAMESDLNEKQSKIQQLSNQITDLEIKMNDLRVELSETNTDLQLNQTNLKGKQQGFDMAVNKYNHLYQSALNKIENYITQ